MSNSLSLSLIFVAHPGHLWLSTRILHRGIKPRPTSQNQSLVLGSCLEAEQKGTKRTTPYLENGQHSRFCFFSNSQDKTNVLSVNWSLTCIDLTGSSETYCESCCFFLWGFCRRKRMYRVSKTKKLCFHNKTEMFRY